MYKLTKHFIETEIVAPTTGQRFYRDEDVPGLALRVTPKSMSYIFEKRVNGVNKRITIGKYAELTLDAAKNQARIMLGQIAQGIDPTTGKRINTLQDTTLREVLQKFLEIKPIRPETKKNYHYAINKHLEDWLDIPITSITKDMVEQRHHDLTVSPNRLGTPGHGRANGAMKKLSALINFAADRYGTDDEPLIKHNPVSRLSLNRSWHKINPRRRIIASHKLKDWYQAVGTLQNEVARDFMIFLLLTGMRFGESRKLEWTHVDFQEKILNVPREITKSDREHRLPLSEFLVDLLKKRFVYRKNSQWVFPSIRLRGKPISQGSGMVHKVRAKSGIFFTLHDLRRSFLTMGERLDVPPYALKQLVNHSVSNDMTGRYLVLDIERLRSHMSRITNEFLELLGISGSNDQAWKPVVDSELTEFTQLVIPFDDFQIL